jgi:hypothetical protein
MEPAKMNSVSTMDIGHPRRFAENEARMKGAYPVQQKFVTSLGARSAGFLRGTIIVLALSSCGGGFAHAAGPFERLAGEWTGAGSIDLTSGTRERLKCRAKYDVNADTLQLYIRCASDSYNFELRSSATVASGAVTGTWSESPHGAFGTIAGTASGESIRVKAEAGSFTANLSLVTHSNSQSVSIRTANPDAGIKGATINMKRGS